MESIKPKHHTDEDQSFSKFFRSSAAFTKLKTTIDTYADSVRHNLMDVRAGNAQQLREFLSTSEFLQGYRGITSLKGIESATWLGEEGVAALNSNIVRSGKQSYTYSSTLLGDAEENFFHWAETTDGTLHISFLGTHLNAQRVGLAQGQLQPLAPFRYGLGGGEMSGRVFAGFDTLYEEIRPAVLKVVRNAGPNVKKLSLAGHSLGGAYASMVTVDKGIAPHLPRSVIAVSTPPVGDKLFNTLFGDTNIQYHRVAHRGDPILFCTGLTHPSNRVWDLTHVSEDWVPSIHNHTLGFLSERVGTILADPQYMQYPDSAYMYSTQSTRALENLVNNTAQSYPDIYENARTLTRTLAYNDRVLGGVEAGSREALQARCLELFPNLDEAVFAEMGRLDPLLVNRGLLQPTNYEEALQAARGVHEHWYEQAAKSAQQLKSMVVENIDKTYLDLTRRYRAQSWEELVQLIPKDSVRSEMADGVVTNIGNLFQDPKDSEIIPKLKMADKMNLEHILMPPSPQLLRQNAMTKYSPMSNNLDMLLRKSNIPVSVDHFYDQTGHFTQRNPADVLDVVATTPKKTRQVLGSDVVDDIAKKNASVYKGGATADKEFNKMSQSGWLNKAKNSGKDMLSSAVRSKTGQTAIKVVSKGVDIVQKLMPFVNAALSGKEIVDDLKDIDDKRIYIDWNNERIYQAYEPQLFHYVKTLKLLYLQVQPRIPVAMSMNDFVNFYFGRITIQEDGSSLLDGKPLDNYSLLQDPAFKQGIYYDGVDNTRPDNRTKELKLFIDIGKFAITNLLDRSVFGIIPSVAISLADDAYDQDRKDFKMGGGERAAYKMGRGPIEDAAIRRFFKKRGLVDPPQPLLQLLKLLTREGDANTLSDSSLNVLKDMFDSVSPATLKLFLGEELYNDYYSHNKHYLYNPFKNNVYGSAERDLLLKWMDREYTSVMKDIERDCKPLKDDPFYYLTHVSQGEIEDNQVKQDEERRRMVTILQGLIPGLQMTGSWAEDTIVFSRNGMNITDTAFTLWYLYQTYQSDKLKVSVNDANEIHIVASNGEDFTHVIQLTEYIKQKYPEFTVTLTFDRGVPDLRVQDLKGKTSSEAKDMLNTINANKDQVEKLVQTFLAYDYLRTIYQKKNPAFEVRLEAGTGVTIVYKTTTGAVVDITKKINLVESLKRNPLFKDYTFEFSNSGELRATLMNSDGTAVAKTFSEQDLYRYIDYDSLQETYVDNHDDPSAPNITRTAFDPLIEDDLGHVEINEGLMSEMNGAPGDSNNVLDQEEQLKRGATEDDFVPNGQILFPFQTQQGQFGVVSETGMQLVYNGMTSVLQDTTYGFWVGVYPHGGRPPQSVLDSYMLAYHVENEEEDPGVALNHLKARIQKAIESKSIASDKNADELRYATVLLHHMDMYGNIYGVQYAVSQLHRGLDASIRSELVAAVEPPFHGVLPGTYDTIPPIEENPIRPLKRAAEVALQIGDTQMATKFAKISEESELLTTIAVEYLNQARERVASTGSLPSGVERLIMEENLKADDEYDAIAQSIGTILQKPMSSLI